MPPGHSTHEDSSSHLVSWFLQNHINPALDFTQTPPGMLALDNMLYLAKVHQDTYIRVKAGAAPRSWCPSCVPPLNPHFLSACRSCWRTVAARTNTSVHSDAVLLSSPRCCARSCRSGSSVSLHSQMSGGTEEGLRRGTLVPILSLSSPSAYCPQ